MKVKVALVPEITDGARNLPEKGNFDGWMVSRIEIPFAQIADSDILCFGNGVCLLRSLGKQLKWANDSYLARKLVEVERNESAKLFPRFSN
jgi:hypothetical protein